MDEEVNKIKIHLLHSSLAIINDQAVTFYVLLTNMKRSSALRIAYITG